MSSAIFRTIKGRRSVRSFLEKEVSDSVLEKILDAARWAPSAHNSQPWRFIVVKDIKTKQVLAKAMAESWNNDLKKDEISTKERQNLIRGSIRRFTDPPIIIVVCLTMDGMNKYTDKKRNEAEFIMASQSVANSIQNILLAVYAERLGACWFCAPLFCQKTVRRILGIPKNVYPQTLITLGYPAEKPIVPPRKPLESIVYQNQWSCKR